MSKQPENWLCRIIGHRMTRRADYPCGCYSEYCGRKGCKIGNVGLSITPAFSFVSRPEHLHCPMAS